MQQCKLNGNFTDRRYRIIETKGRFSGEPLFTLEVMADSSHPFHGTWDPVTSDGSLEKLVWQAVEAV